MKTGRAAGLSEVNIEMINASGQVGVEVMTELCQKVLDGAGRDGSTVRYGTQVRYGTLHFSAKSTVR